MDNIEKYNYWLDIAQYDLKAAESMLKSGHWLYVVFMCQQAIEKLVKGLYSYYKPDIPPFMHNIKTIAARFESNLPSAIPENTMEFFDELTAYYINNRYPDYVSKLSTQIDETEAADIMAKSKEVFAWLLTLKP